MLASSQSATCKSNRSESESPRSAAKLAAHTRAAMWTANVDGEYPPASSQRSWRVAGPCRIKYAAAFRTIGYGSKSRRPSERHSFMRQKNWKSHLVQLNTDRKS